MSQQKVYACVHCLDGVRPVLYLARESGDLMLACGGDDHTQSTDDWKVVHLTHLIERDASLQVLPELTDDYEADRASPGGAWRTRPIR